MSDIKISELAVVTTALPTDYTVVVTDGSTRAISLADLYAASEVVSGSFTPTFAFATAGDQSAAPTTAVGRYSKKGNVVSFAGKIAITPVYTTSANNVRIGGLPFPAMDVTEVNGVVNIIHHTSALAYGTGYTHLCGRVEPAASFFILTVFGSGKNTGTITTTQVTTGVAQSLTFAGWYLTDS